MKARRSMRFIVELKFDYTRCEQHHFLDSPLHFRRWRTATEMLDFLWGDLNTCGGSKLMQALLHHLRQKKRYNENVQNLAFLHVNHKHSSLDLSHNTSTWPKSHPHSGHVQVLIGTLPLVGLQKASPGIGNAFKVPSHSGRGHPFPPRSIFPSASFSGTRGAGGTGLLMRSINAATLYTHSH